MASSQGGGETEKVCSTNLQTHIALCSSRPNSAPNPEPVSVGIRALSHTRTPIFCAARTTHETFFFQLARHELKESFEPVAHLG